ncbi:hypothetical protein [Bacillus sp. ISTL8]|uniref:hypothetical protein n=1 Tax=Bacillus sp. ISTL8 TaxID=2596896 RepID=UPI001457535D|nr:hypothetical protein [Bacillus sp. ISTL8]
MKLRRWVKVALVLMAFGAIAGMFKSMVFAQTTDEKPEYKVYHGVIEMNLNGKSKVVMLDGKLGEDVNVKVKEEYNKGQIITVVFEGNRVVEDYITEGKELDKILDKNQASIEEVKGSKVYLMR